MEPEAKAYQEEQGGSSKQQDNNTELMYMLKRMEHNMMEIDNQMKAQLKIRDK